VIEVASAAVVGLVGSSPQYIASLDVVTITISGVGAFIGALSSMVSAVGTAALYFELRQDKEGVSVADLAAVFE
jgi:hypothetical protein